ncbi:MAG: threonylcarbamoyl-AMP synthase [Nanoarchaeota archaeon]|nr:threonylcarbamoyl-AMP synthase [Nanoarchaeota archaeon]MBU1854532.1 threonylcarbamoyl-AMP synthase [Nanoarchaeota archaeon]
MEALNKDEFFARKHFLTQKLKSSVFIYPTDTIYGIGCVADDEELVDRIRVLKKRFDMPFSVIAPSKDWIRENCVVSKNAEEWLDKLPGPYTLILKLKNPSVIAENVNLGVETLGVRIPDNWFSEVVASMNLPIITTSANVSGKDFMTSIEDLDPVVAHGVDVVVHDGFIKGKPSTLVFLDKNAVSLKER